MPQRVHRGDGSWQDIDLTLVAGADGKWAPRASAADVLFSAGGQGPLAKIVKDGHSFDVSWPLGSLPKPATSADTATYAEVLPGVDLVVRATSDGFAHVLVVKTAEAAKDSRLKQITFNLGGDAVVRKTHGGDVVAVAGGQTVAATSAAAMWDSSQTGAAAAKLAGASGASDGDVSTPAKPADAAQVADVRVTVDAAGDLVLEPDAGLLADATFPLFIDPVWSTGKSRWAYSTNNNSNNTDTSVARVGRDPNSGIVYRSYFEFPTAPLKDRYIYDAYVQMKVDHSWSCTNTPNTLFTSNPISGTPRSAWKSTGWYLKLMGQVSSHANEGAGCSDSPQPDMTINFNTDAVKNTIQTAATKASPSVTFVLSAVDKDVSGESTQDRWKKYFPGNAKLITEFDNRPGTPTEFYVNGVRCGSNTLGIGTTALKFTARMPDRDTTQSIKATWEWERRVNTTWTAMPAPAVSNAAANTIATSAAISGAVNGNTYRFRVKGTDPSPYNQSSQPSQWCTFTIDTADPTVTGEVTTQPTGPGRPGRFTLISHDADLVKFRYGWNAAVNEIAPSSTTTAGGVTTKSVTVTLSPPKYGTNTLYLQGVDSTLNVGDGSLTFVVGRASPPVARWGLETRPGVDSAEALADQQPTLADNTPLAGEGLAFTDKQRLIGGAQATFTGTQNLATAAGVLDTTKSYGVAAWVRLNDMTGYQTFVSQDGQNVTNFQLQFRSDDRNGDGTADKSFCFAVRDADVAATQNVAMTCAVNTAVAGQWTHLAGTFDAVEKKLRIWVNGTFQAEAAAPATAWASSGPLRIATRKYDPLTWLDNFAGGIADVQVFDRAIVQEDLTGHATDPEDAVEAERGIVQPIQVADWNFEDAVLCWDPAVENVCEEPDNATGFGHRLRLTQGVDIVPGSGMRGNYAAFDNRQINWNDPSDPFYGTTTREFGASQRNSGDLSNPQWQDAPVLYTNQSFTLSVRVHVESTTSTMTALAAKGTKHSAFYLGTRSSTIGGITAQRFEVMVPSIDQDLGETWTHVIAPEALDVEDEGTWHLLTLVYNAGSKTMRLYVNGVAKTPPTAVGVWNAAGPLMVGSAWFTPDNGTGAYYDQWYGGIDNVRIYQGAMTVAQVAHLSQTDDETES
ncbi:LamG domain-containing protein [Actinoplanes sp. LDG1-06]|uniref:LamG domain-containing protein n=1 Tax=Paractinoplanes ovalisporus TaxID=2810368 RepID=A0ABS2AVH7_9ACTN|nr:LamG domain-containing protein [Actinoplanes ovalisporus]MBM2623801.1 LamG domain-containing protein [Actinoplanes ovalisporus]